MEDVEDVENSYIMREYFKAFKCENRELNLLREKINKTDRNLILDNIVKQNKEIYKMISSNYSKSIDIVIYTIIIVSFKE